VLLEAFHPSVSRTHQRLVNAPLLGFRPLQRSTALGARMPRELQPPATIRPQGFQPSRRLASPKTMQASSRFTASGLSTDDSCTPAALLGFHRTSGARLRSFDHWQGDGARVPSSRLSPPLRRTRFGGLSSLALRAPRGNSLFKGNHVGASGAAESRSQKSRCIPKELPPGTGLPEVLDRPSCS